MRVSILAPVSFVLTCLLASGCDWNTKADYSPKHGFQSFLKKQEEAKTESEKTGSSTTQAAAGEPGKQTFETYCVACHGLNGKADGAAAQALNPKPRNFTDKAWQAKVDDAHIAKVIKEGGAAVGLSASMAPWGAVVKDDEIKNLVQYLRNFGK